MVAVVVPRDIFIISSDWKWTSYWDCNMVSLSFLLSVFIHSFIYLLSQTTSVFLRRLIAVRPVRRYDDGELSKEKINVNEWKKVGTVFLLQFFFHSNERKIIAKILDGEAMEIRRKRKREKIYRDYNYLILLVLLHKFCLDASAWELLMS